ncbi:hypothetical protein L228DRAFT_242873 [Xylona heveae TC161]|uniref:Uncharacterized protein n=1 Tax=Xylona heveae (strain CBS 132557 / TC161) TaxID=1328760 RepID=A0A165JM10_XYLHT|nr:hypothetical protein L228DRAFT_242873 [Xylona heveae TC161]KZF26409.1 hypothetical protein L228DRAFT_242873 [Xylona heveae TC161]
MSEIDRDFDGDSQMRSSSSESDLLDEDSLFPDSKEPLTPTTRHPNTRAQLAAELSPPPSQSRPVDAAAGGVAIAGPSGKQAISEAFGAQAAPLVSAVAEGRPVWEGSGENEPGWGWKNPKAQEEMKKATESLLDKDIDPFVGMKDPLLGNRNFAEELEKYKRRDF